MSNFTVCNRVNQMPVLVRKELLSKSYQNLDGLFSKKRWLLELTINVKGGRSIGAWGGFD
jgi:hypothetical protein